MEAKNEIESFKKGFRQFFDKNSTIYVGKKVDGDDESESNKTFLE